MVVLVSAATSVAAQNTGNPSGLAQGQKIFTEQCAACHGTDAYGTDRAPSLVGNRELRRSSVQQLRAVIHNGIPDSGMPAFDLPSEQLDAVAGFVHSLNSPASEATVAGDAEAGKQFFTGQGQCASCHMIDGNGKAVGPDLSNTGREMTVDEIREALVEPSEHITPGYEMVMVESHDAGTVRGFARSRSNFDIVVQDLTGQFHLLEQSEIVAIKDEKQSLMPPVKASPADLQNLVAYLSKLTAVKPGEANITASGDSGGIEFSRILHPKPGDWLTYNGDLSGNRYSPLTAINTTNVRALVPKWTFSILHFGLEVTPIVADGIMYATGANQAYALDALTGRKIWSYSRPRTPGLLGDAALGSNRGMAILGDKVFMVTDNAHLIALNRTTGALVWDQVMPDAPMHYGSTVAPLAVKDMIVAGVSGGDRGMRGFVVAYRASDGKRLWRFWTVPSKGEPMAETWGGDPPADGGGATWLTGSYDPETDTLFWATGNPFPDSDDRKRPGINLYTNCVLALDPATGNLKWYYQFTPHDVRDIDANQPLVLTDTAYQGRMRKLLMIASRNGFFYVLDRTNGHVLTAKSFVSKVTWASGIGPDGRPRLSPTYVPPPGGEISCPACATNWNSTAFSPLTRLFYVIALEECEFRTPPGGWGVKHPKLPPGQDYLRALDIRNGKIAWEIPLAGQVEAKVWPGVLATASGIVFFGTPSGDFVAADQQTGEPLWHFSTSGPMRASPMTFAVHGKQFVAIAVGPNIMCFGLP